MDSRHSDKLDSVTIHTLENVNYLATIYLKVHFTMHFKANGLML